MPSTSIKNWAEDDRPREKLLSKGTDALSNAELLAILINNGTKNKSALELAKEILHHAGNDLHKLAALSVKELLALKVKGFGPAKAVTVSAALEIGIRRSAGTLTKEVVKSSSDIAEYLRQQFQYKKNEVFAVVFLNNANKINHFEIVSEGGITGTIADPRIIIKKALLHDAVSIVLCHNHPSGNTKPSMQDQMITEKLKAAAIQLDIKVIDHIIVSAEGYYSFADSGML